MWNRILFTIKTAALRRKSGPNTKFVQALNLQITESLAAKYGRPVFVISPVFKFSAAVSAVVIMLVSGIGVYAQSSPSVNETHPLYPIKRSMEDMREIVALTPTKRAEVAMDKAEERLKETERLGEQNIVAVRALKDAGNDVREVIKLTREIRQDDDLKNVAEAVDKLDARRAEKIEKLLSKKNGKMRPEIEKVVAEDDLDELVDELNDDSTVEEMDILRRGVGRRVRLAGKMMENDDSDLPR